MIPKNISRKHILNAIEEIDRSDIPRSRKSKKFQLLYNDKHYPPKYVISLANKYANNRELTPSEFGGGQETNSFLEKLGFEIVELKPYTVSVKPWSTTRKIKEKKISRHDERCPECKKTIERMLKEIYGSVKTNYKFEMGTTPDDYKDFPFYQKLEEIFSELQQYRGHKVFVRTSTLPHCDFFVPDPGFIVEYDESQHFTIPRQLSLLRYPENLKLSFSKEKWIRLCDEIEAKDNDPPFRDEQRAWYDTLRDFLPESKKLKPTVRLFSREMRWCSLNPGIPSDVKKFKALLEGRKENWKIEIKEDPNPSLARIIIAEEWDGDVKIAKKLLQEICEKWPKGKKVKCIITCGAFLNFNWPDFLPNIGDNRNPNPQAVKYLIKEAQKQCDSLFNGDLYEKLREHTDYLTIGIDSRKDKISLAKNYIGTPHIELICLIDLRTKRYHWTGKSYPTPNQEKGLIRITDMNTHFFNSDFGKIMILGCHDLTIFNPRSKNAKGWRRGINDEFRNLAKKERSTCVLQHPHTTDSIRTWAAAWNELRRILPTVDKYASAGRYHNPDGVRSDLDEVLKKTKCGNTKDIIIEIRNKINDLCLEHYTKAER